jgi:hypothetical protein
MTTVTVTKAMIAHEICGHLCGIAEACQDSSYPLDTKFKIIKDWNNGQPLVATWETVLKGCHCYAGYGCDPEKTRIPEFISKDWNRAIKIYKKLKGL